MIMTKSDLKEFIIQDSKANGRETTIPKFLGDEVWKFQLCMRALDYYDYKRIKNRLFLPLFFLHKLVYHYISIKLGFSIANYKNIDKGLSLVHYGTIIINQTSHIGKNCRIHAGVNIGATNGEKQAPNIGDNVYSGPGAKIVGNITIADNVCIGANATVVKSIAEPNTTWGGTPAKKISDNSSFVHLSSMLFEK